MTFVNYRMEFTPDLLFSTVFESATEGILLADAQGTIVMANPACHRLFGYDQLKGMKVEALMPPAIAEKHQHHRDGFFSSPAPRPMGKGMMLMGKKKNGGHFPLEISLSYVKEPVPLALAFITDISERHQQEKALQAAAEKYNSVIEHAVDGIIVTNKQGEIELVNPAVERLFGYEASELKGKRITLLMPGPYRQEHDGYMNRYHDTGEKRIIGIGREVAGLKKNGDVFPLHLSISEVDLGHQIIYTGIIHDLTKQKEYERQLKEYSEHLEKKVKERTFELEEVNTFLEEQMEELLRAQDAVRRSERMYKLIARNFPNGTINVFDRDLNYVFVEGKELFEMGITSEKLIGTNFLDRLDANIGRIAHKELMEVFNGEPRSFEIEFKNQHYVLTAVPLGEGLNKPIDQILVVERNTTKQKKAEEGIRKALEKEQQLGELKSRFVTMASHEFRTPLSTIASSATLISKYVKEEDQEKRNKHTQRIQSNVKHLTNILNDFLSLGKLEEGKVENKPEHFDIKFFCDDMVEEMQLNLKPGQRIQYTHTGKERELFLDSKLLRHVLINLLSNAIKYSPEGKEIGLHTELSGHGFSVSVHDQGIGIPEEELPHLFTRFFRATNTGNIQGTGMGLNIVSKYLDLMGGRIEVESKLGKGTAFTVYFSGTDTQKV